MARLKGISRNLNAVLDMISVTEGTSTSKHTRDDGYDIVVGGVDSPNRFDSYLQHPNILVTVNSKGLKSTAAGRYQALNRYAKHYIAMLRLKDFGPESQDLIAIQQMREFKALDLIEKGDIVGVIARINPLWASLPGNNYGQHQFALEKCIAIYQQKGGQLWIGSSPSSGISESLSPVSSVQLPPPLLPTKQEGEKANESQEVMPKQNVFAQILNALIRMFKKNPKS